MSNQIKVILKAPLLANSGYGVHSRQVAKALFSDDTFDVYCDPINISSANWLLHNDLENGLIGKIKNSAHKELPKEKVPLSIQLCLPVDWTPSLAEKNVGMSALVETDLCNPNWFSNASVMDLLIFPSTHCKNVLENTNTHFNNPKLNDLYQTILGKTIIIPESFPENYEDKNKISLQLNLSTNFNFLSVAQLNANPNDDRKNIFKLIKYFCEVFEKNEKIGLILKTNLTKGSIIDRFVTEEVLKQALVKYRKGLYPKIYLVHGYMNNEEMRVLYQNSKVKAFVSLTRGECFGLPQLEAAACGLPVITTNWSGHLDFLSQGHFLPIDFDLQNISKTKIDNKIFIPGAKWAEPKEENVKYRLNKFAESPEKPTEWAEDLQKIILENYNQTNIAKQYINQFKKLLNVLDNN